ncbi:DUF2946 domain-containing protein [uncultured Acinetobacter sp.]|uniref:DUF2946 domain-containing protein n=1 Tax=uncultured Acinetobacter sp. TaxID=165433 RepID=UPI00260C459D|nr:DUF2946 domain-containing protein [uncultured Acinetobacter sp.]
MLRRGGLLLVFAAVLLQLAVHLQPLLPEQYHIAPACHALTHRLLTPIDTHDHADQSDEFDFKRLLVYHHEHVHDLNNHHCQYCTVHADTVLPLNLNVDQVIDRIQVRYLAFIQNHKQIYFALQRLFLMPQGRAPPIAL